MRLLFNGCQPDFIRDVCHGRCCWVSGDPNGTTIKVEPDQRTLLTTQGAKFNGSVLITIGEPKRCGFQDRSCGTCSLHNTPAKPRSCIQSPFMLTVNDKLIIRNRYKMLSCYEAEPKLPVYKAFATGLVLLFGEEEAKRLTDHLENGGNDIIGYMLAERYHFIKEVKAIWTKKTQVKRRT